MTHVHSRRGRCAGGDARRRVGQPACRAFTAGREGKRESGPQKAGRRMPVQMALRTGMSEFKFSRALLGEQWPIYFTIASSEKTWSDDHSPFSNPVRL